MNLENVKFNCGNYPLKTKKAQSNDWTFFSTNWILNPARLPIPPLRHFKIHFGRLGIFFL